LVVASVKKVSRKMKLIKFTTRLTLERSVLLADEDHEKPEWLRLLCTGDHGAFAEFVDEYKGQVFLCCRTLGLRDDEADDVASETFLAAYRAIARYRAQAELGTWLWSIAYRQAVNYLRKNRRPCESIGPKGDNTQQDQTTRALYENEQQELVWDAVKRLPRPWAVAVILYYRQEKGIREIAEIMRTRQNTVKTYLFRARMKLKELLPDVLGEDIYEGR
jgi:RNA polymerase sigma factor (sigma-70 family)